MGVIFINNKQILLPKSVFFAIADDTLLFLKPKIDDDIYNQIAGSVNGIKQLDLDDLDSDIIRQLLAALKKSTKNYNELQPYVEKILNQTTVS